MNLEMMAWMFAGIFIAFGIMVIFFSRDADLGFKIFCRAMCILPFGGAVYFVLVALNIVKVFILIPM
ncbi:MAG: hypothetical protein UT90_C0001G0038 [Parcubacteria group bacterium GW2011_GWA1_40_21]|nr:MAG: hypothetical protein UT80_C0007G0006 [Parcubacteria group bacterium GW2011_GWC1_40_13]KKR54165.1 MAG: hypothetical protein UT90_C0001G0038 [Parcubacteria group bacterium GW2011_GWA1_40_21]